MCCVVAIVLTMGESQQPCSPELGADTPTPGTPDMGNDDAADIMGVESSSGDFCFLLSIEQTTHSRHHEH